MSQGKHLHPEIAAVLRGLRRRIRRYVLYEGVALVFALAGALFWLGFGLDWLYFSVSSLELPRWFRLAFDAAGVTALSLGLFLWIGVRWWRGLHEKALALVLERRFPELNDRLVTAVECADEAAGPNAPLTRAMLSQTIEDASRAVSNLTLKEVFDTRPRTRALVAALVLFGSIGGVAWGNEAALNRWVRAFVRAEPHYWNRQTELVVRVIAEPGDRVRNFRDYRYKHPRGADLNLLVIVPEGKKVPEHVQLRYQLEGGHGRALAYCAQAGPRSFRYAVGGLLDSMQFDVFGGDYRTRRSYFVEVVDPPRVDRIVLRTIYPDYTRMNRQDPETGKVVPSEHVVYGTQVSLPIETWFRLEAQCNKPLVAVRIETDFGPDRLQLEFGRETSTASSAPLLTRKSADGTKERTWRLSPPAEDLVLAADGMHFSAPFALVKQAPESFDFNSPSDVLPLPLPADSRIRLYLEDVDDIASAEAIRLTVNGIVDQPPVIDTQLKGIGSSITRKALIPVAGTISDDYGLNSVRFEYRVENDEQWSPRPFEGSLTGTPVEFRLQRSGSEPFERFEVLPLDLEIGRKLTLTVFAEDGDNLNGPHSARGERYLFEIVSNEEVLSILYAKELNLRRRFEQILSEIKQVQQDLIEHEPRVDDWRRLQQGTPGSNGDDSRAELQSVEVLIMACAERSLHAIHKNRSEMVAVEETFGDIREEMVNNAVQTRQMLERIDNRILAPLKAVNEFDFSSVDEALALFRAAIERKGDARSWIGESIQRIGGLVRHMEAILQDMRKLETFQEALELLKSIIQQQEDLNQKTKNERKRRLIESIRSTN